MTASTRTLAAPRVGSPKAALQHRPFRLVYFGGFASNIGTWMQNVALISFADQIENTALFVGVITFAQLGPMLLVSPFGGVIADLVNRKTLMIGAALVQGMLSVVLGFLALGDTPNRVALVACVAGIGLASAINGPASQATLPALVGIEDLPGAVSLNSAQMNLSRVIGPIIVVAAWFQVPAHVFFVNAATYLFVIGAIALAQFDAKPPPMHHQESPIQRLLGGIALARADSVISSILISISVYSFFSLVFIYQMRGFARTELGLGPDRYYLLFACFGLGAAAGAVAVGTILSSIAHTLLAKVGFASFSATLALYSLNRAPTLAYLLVAATGFCYFIVVTTLSTSLQQTVSHEARARVMGLWMMGWAGLVPVGSLVGGYLIDQFGHTAITLGGAAVALMLAGTVNLGSGSSRLRPIVPELQSDSL
jgi:MFS family permease